MTTCVTLQKLKGLYAIAQLGPAEPIPAWADGGGFVSISRGDDELSIVCVETRIPASVKSDRDWACLKVAGPFAFDQTGIVLSIVRPLSERQIGVFVVSTFNGDYLLVKSGDLDMARRLLRESGHIVI